MATLTLVPTDEEAALRESVAGICSRFGPKYMRECNAQEKPPTELWDALAEPAATSASTSPRSTAAAGSACPALAAVGEEISAAGCSLLLIVVSPAIFGIILVRHGTTEQKERWLPRHRGRARCKVAFAITEPDAGIELAQPLDRRAHGRRRATCCAAPKTFISGVEDADAILVVARQRRERRQRSACRCC